MGRSVDNPGGCRVPLSSNNLSDAVANLTKIRRAGDSIQQRHSVKQDAGGEGAEQKILHRRFVRALFAFCKSNENIKR